MYELLGIGLLVVSLLVFGIVSLGNHAKRIPVVASATRIVEQIKVFKSPDIYGGFIRGQLVLQGQNRPTRIARFLPHSRQAVLELMDTNGRTFVRRQLASLRVI